MNNQERQREILDLIKGFCAEKLNDEYVEIAERPIAKLARKRINPMSTRLVQRSSFLRFFGVGVGGDWVSACIMCVITSSSDLFT